MTSTDSRTSEQTARTRHLVDMLPKVELHSHLAGSVPEWLFVETANRHGITIAGARPYDFHGQLAEFLVVFDQVADSFRQPEDLYRATYESLLEEARDSRLRYREIHFSPTISHHVPYDESVDAVARGMKDARRDVGVDSRIIVAIYRNQGAAVAERLMSDMLRYPHPMVVGVGIEADKTLGPIEWFDTAYQFARDAGYGLTAHAGERDDVAEVEYAVNRLGCRRIDHGYALATDAAAAARMAEIGVHFAATWVSAIADHGATRHNPIRAMIDSGLDVSISSDDAAICRRSLQQQLIEAAEIMDLSDDYLIAQTRSQLNAAWVDAGTKSAISADIESALAASGCL